MVRTVTALGMAASMALAAPATLGGMGQVTEWTDYENQSNEMPSSIFGTCDADNADRIGLYVEFDDGTTASVTYSGVSGVWNTSNFPGMASESSSGFLASCTGFHFLHNTTASLPMAWESCALAGVSSNFDLDYSESFGSHFRASQAGWVSATFTTYCDTAAAPAPVTVPLFGPFGYLLLSGLLGFFGYRKLR